MVSERRSALTAETPGAPQRPTPPATAGSRTPGRSAAAGPARNAMLFAFDLWRVEDVPVHAALILERLERGDMPCDAPWPPDRIATFKSWIEGGCAV